MDKKSLSEADIISKFIMPAVKDSGWDDMLQIRQEVALRDGKVIVRGNIGMRTTVKSADIVLYHKPNMPLAVIEAKANKHEMGKGMQQSLDYARLLDVPFAFASNGDGFIFHDKTAPANGGQNGHLREGSEWGVLKVSDVSCGEYRPNENKKLPSNLESREQCEVVAGDFLISRANTAELVARAVVVPTNTPDRLMMSDKIILFSFSRLVEGEYINLVNASQLPRDYYAAVAGGTSSSMKMFQENISVILLLHYHQKVKLKEYFLNMLPC